MRLVQAEVITIGDEILYGQITDTNTQYISAELDKIGIKTLRKISIGDDKSEILNMLEDSLSRADIVLITGGLGPTKDDITKNTLANYFGDELVMNESALSHLEKLFMKFGVELTEINRQQAAIPSRATYLANQMGTAPGMWFEHKGKIVVSMPGVPFEMKYLMNNEVIPRLKTFFETPVILHKIIRTVGVGESFLSDLIEGWEMQLPPHIKLAYLPNLGQVRLRLTGIGSKEEALKAELEAESEKVYPLIEKFIFSLDNEELEMAIGRMLIEKNSTLATAESCTGGYLAHSITKFPGSSAYYLGTVVSYANSVKMSLLAVKKETLDTVGAVSEETVIQMAEGARKTIGSTYALATSGIAGPGGGTEEKPVGTIWMACAGPNGTTTQKIVATKNRVTNIHYGSKVALNLLRKMILKTE